MARSRRPVSVLHVRRVDQLADLTRRQDAPGQEIFDMDIRHGPGRIEQDRVGVFQMREKAAQTDLVGSDGVGGHDGAEDAGLIVGDVVPRDFAQVGHARRGQPCRKVTQDGVRRARSGPRSGAPASFQVIFDDLIDIHKPLFPPFW